MLLSSKQLFDLPVETKSGIKLGQISGFNMDVETQKIWQYLVKPPLIKGGFLKEALLIHQGQVVSLTKEKMVVLDNVVKYQTKNPNLGTLKQESWAGTVG